MYNKYLCVPYALGRSFQCSRRAVFEYGKHYYSTSNKIKKPTHYDTLGLPDSATSEDIRNAYIKLSKRYHPDMNRGDDASLQGKFVEINDAYSVLSNPHSKFDYDFLLGNMNRNKYNTDLSGRSTYRPNSEHYESYDFFKGEGAQSSYSNSNNSNNTNRNKSENEQEWDVKEDIKAISNLRDITYRFIGLFVLAFIIALVYLRHTRDDRKNEKSDQ